LTWIKKGDGHDQRNLLWLEYNKLSNSSSIAYFPHWMRREHDRENDRFNRFFAHPRLGGRDAKAQMTTAT